MEWETLDVTDKRNGYESPCLALDTEDGKRLLVAGIVTKGKGVYWKKKFAELASFTTKATDIVGIDYALARAIEEMADGDESLIVCACSYGGNCEEMDEDETTGGVMGDPLEEIESSDDDTEELRDFFYMYTQPGGPGLCADANPRVVEEALDRLEDFLPIFIDMQKKARSGEDTSLKIKSEVTLQFVLQEYDITTALLVCDGTGKNAVPFLAAMDEDGVNILM